MELTGERLLPASRDRVWAALNDPEVLKRCIPGCQEIAKLSDTELTAKVGLSVGPVKATFTGRVTLSEIDAPNGYKISGEGQGGVAGFGKGSAVVKLTDDPAGTRLTYAADAAVGGKLAQIGSRLVEATARKLADEFFTRFADEFPAVAAAAPAATPEPADAATSAATPAPAAPTAPAGARLSPAIWVPALVAILAIAYWMTK
ncbi:MAG: carbon monoxide dehydrogenase subunit G [Alphaproteobacteria bacterium]|nr:carbon monoxide dehydrogenase subunit G [Alphaproteobacteria bacterium]